MTKRVRDGSITLDGHDAQSLEVARQVGSGLLMVRIDHLIRDDYVCNPLLNDLVTDFGDDIDVNNDARDSDQSNSSDCVTQAMVNVRCREFPRSVLQADTIIVSCRLANFQRTSWSTQRCPKFGRSYDELETEADNDKFVDSFEDNYPGVCSGRPTSKIDCRNFDDPDCDKRLRIHVGRGPRIMRSIMESKNYHELHSRMYAGMSRFSSTNVVIMTCRSGRHRSVAKAELWSNTLTRCGRQRHSVSLLHLSGLDFWENTCALRPRPCRVFSTCFRVRLCD